MTNVELSSLLAYTVNRWLASIMEMCCPPTSAESRLRGARGIYYPRGPFAAEVQHLPRQRVQEKQCGGGGKKIN